MLIIIAALPSSWKVFETTVDFPVSVALWSLLAWWDGGNARGHSVIKKVLVVVSFSLVWLVFLQNILCVLLGMLLLSQHLLCFCRWACESFCGDISFRCSHQEDAIIVATCSQHRSCLFLAANCGTHHGDWEHVQQSRRPLLPSTKEVKQKNGEIENGHVDSDATPKRRNENDTN